MKREHNDLGTRRDAGTGYRSITRDRAADWWPVGVFERRVQVSRASGFTMRQHARNGCHHVLLAGELDDRTGRQLVRLLLRVCPDAHEITVDMRAVTFIDSAGLGRLMAVKAICAEHYVDVVLIATDPGPGGDAAAPLGPLDRRAPRAASLACEFE
jgi:anti-anti-sigma factor